MSSSRDLIILIGTPGICLAILTASVTYSLRVRRPKPVPSIRRWTTHLSAGRPDAAIVAASAASPFCDDGPDLALLRRVERRGVHRLEADVVLVGIGIDRLDLLGRAAERGLHVARLVADELGIRGQSFLEPLGDRFRGHIGVRALVPFDRQRVECGLGLPPGIGDHGDRLVVDLNDLLDALHAGDFGRRRSSSPCRRTPDNP